MSHESTLLKDRCDRTKALSFMVLKADKRAIIGMLMVNLFRKQEALPVFMKSSLEYRKYILIYYWEAGVGYF